MNAETDYTSKFLEIVRREQYAFVTDADEISWIKSPTNRMKLVKAGVFVKAGKNGALVIYRSTVPADEVTEFIENGDATAAVVKPPSVWTVTAAAQTAKPAMTEQHHTYIPPAVASDIQRILTDELSQVLWLTGPSQCGKDKVVHYVAEMCLGRRVFQVNCRGDMDSSVFLGEKTVDIDRATAQNFVRFQKGMIELAMTEGLKKDENGNEVFDENGDVIVEGKPGVLFIDEAAAMPAHVAIALNRLLESDDNVRTFVIDNDGGREVKSHPDFRIVFASNTVGRGASDLSSNMYTAQNDSLDVSLLNRVTSFIRMGYSRTAEQKILREKIRDDKEVSTLLNFRDRVREAIRSGKLMSMLSTAHLIHIADNFRIFDRDMPKAIYYAVFNSLLPEEKAVYSEFISALWGVTSLEQSIEESGVDYF